MFKNRVFSTFILVLFMLAAIEPAAAQEKSFAQSGTIELGGDISFKTTTPVSNGQTGNTLMTFSAMPFVGYFVISGLELGVNPVGVGFTNVTDHTSTRLLFLFAPSYNFRTGGIAYPFVEALGGYTSLSATDLTTTDGYVWGGRAGVKIAVTGRGLLNIGAQYLLYSYNIDGGDGRSGLNELTALVGFTVWF